MFFLFDGIDHPIRITRSGTTTYYELDLAGNLRGLRASGGASLGGYRYSAFGQTLEDTSSITQPLRWKGRWFSPAAGGTYDVRARQWSPELGIFLTVDEFIFHDRRSTLWSWGNQNPIKLSDPEGNQVHPYRDQPPLPVGTKVCEALTTAGTQLRRTCCQFICFRASTWSPPSTSPDRSVRSRPHRARMKVGIQISQAAR